MEPHPFRVAAEAEDVELMTETLREDVVLHRPILFPGLAGSEILGQGRTQAPPPLENLTDADELVGEDSVCLRFTAKVGDRELEGIDYLQLDGDGKVVDLTVFMRPLSAINAFNEQMKLRLGVA